MDVMTAIRLRKSVRQYLSRSVEAEKIRQVLEAARLAPSASNRQEWRFVVVTDAVKRTQLASAANNQEFVAQAPVVLACCAETDHHVMRCGQLCYPIDVAIAIDHMTLAAVTLGLGTCWIGAFDADRVKEVLDIPSQISVVELLVLGYPQNPEAVDKKRRSIDAIAMSDTWR